MSIFFDKYSLILILIGILLLLIIAITVLLKLQNRRNPQESIPGVEEMARTTFFWSEYHKGRIGEGESVTGKGSMLTEQEKQERDSEL